MTDTKSSSHGIVVDHKETNIRYAVSDKNFNPKIHRKVRDLKAGETVRGYQPINRESLGEDTENAGGTVPAFGTAGELPGDSDSASRTPASASQTEGSAPAGTKGK